MISRQRSASSRLTPVVRWIVYGLLLCYVFGVARSGTWLASVQAQPDSLETDPGDAPGPRSAGSPSAPAKPKRKVPETLWQMYVASGLVGLIITLCSFAAVGLIVEHSLSIRKQVLMPENVSADLDQLVRQGQLDEAIAYCQDAGGGSLFSQVVLAALQRYRSSEFGFAEYKAAAEEAGEEETGRLYRKTEALGVIGAIAPMLGLLGTVQGMILGFNTIASSGGAAKPEDLASDISLALVTTFEGLVVAIPVMVAFSFFRNRIDSLVTEVGRRVEQVLAPLSRRRM